MAADHFGGTVPCPGNRPFRPTRPLLLAAALVLVVAVVAAVIAIGPGAVRAVLAVPAADTGSATAPPPYYVDIERAAVIVVRSTATGKVTSTVPQPSWYSGGTWVDAAVTASRDGRLFVAAINDWDTRRTRLYEFSLTSDGRVTRFRTLLDRSLPGVTGLSLAISPDGSQVAVAGVPDKRTEQEETDGPPRIIFADLHSEAFSVWDGPAGSGDRDVIQSLSWAANGRSLRFLVSRCPSGRAWPFNTACQGAHAQRAQEWTIGHVGPWVDPGPARPLSTLPRSAVAAVGGPGDDTLSVLEVRRGDLERKRTDVAVVRVSLSSGRVQRVLYAGRLRAEDGYDFMSADGDARYLLVNAGLGEALGWIRDGQPHRLGSPGGVSSAAW